MPRAEAPDALVLWEDPRQTRRPRRSPDDVEEEDQDATHPSPDRACLHHRCHHHRTPLPYIRSWPPSSPPPPVETAMAAAVVCRMPSRGRPHRCRATRALPGDAYGSGSGRGDALGGAEEGRGLGSLGRRGATALEREEGRERMPWTKTVIS
jgi:hypothetical protein